MAIATLQLTPTPHTDMDCALSHTMLAAPLAITCAPSPQQIPDTADGAAEFVCEDPHAWVALGAALALVDRRHRDVAQDGLPIPAQAVVSNGRVNDEGVVVVAACAARLLGAIGATDTARECCDWAAAHAGELPLLQARLGVIRADLNSANA
jgi:hypothetical protein